MAQAQTFAQDFPQGPSVRGFLHRPESPAGLALALCHGAGGNCRAPLLVALAELFSDAGITVLRFDLPYRQAKSLGPPSGNSATDREGIKRAAAALKAQSPGQIFLGGISYGGRQTSMLAAEDSGVADGLLLLSYPLHAPGRPDQPRTAHLPNINMPVLFVHGTKDPFGSVEEMQAAIKLIPGPTSLVVVDGVGHDLGYGRKKSSAASALPQTVLDAFRKLFPTT